MAGWLAGRSSIKFTKYNYAFKHEIAHTQRGRWSFIGPTNWMQTIYENAYRICSYFLEGREWGFDAELFCTLGEFYPCKIDSLIVHSYSYIHIFIFIPIVHKHAASIRFYVFDKKKRWMKMHNNVFIEIQCKLIPFIRTLNLLVVQSMHKERSNKIECEKKTLASSLNELFCQWGFFLIKTFGILILWLNIRLNFRTCRILLQHCACALCIYDH